MAMKIIRSPSTGLTRRTFKMKVWLVIAQKDEFSKTEMLTFATEAQAREICDYIGRDMNPEVHYVERAEFV